MTDALDTETRAIVATTTEVRVIVDLMLSLRELLNRCELSNEAGSNCLGISMVSLIASSALQRAKESVQPAPVVSVSASELSRMVAGEMARRSAARSTP